MKASRLFFSNRGSCKSSENDLVNPLSVFDLRAAKHLLLLIFLLEPYSKSFPSDLRDPASARSELSAIAVPRASSDRPCYTTITWAILHSLSFTSFHLSLVE